MKKIFRCIGYSLEKISYIWCKHVHQGIMYPGGDIYYCRECLRKHIVPWAKGK